MIVGVLGGKAVDAGLAPRPTAPVGTGQAFPAEAIGTGILVFVVFGAAVDARAATLIAPSAPTVAVSSEGVPA